LALAHLPAGRIAVEASRTGVRTSGKPDAPDRLTLTLGPGERRSGVDLVVPGGRTIRGVVAAPDGAPVAGASVWAIDQRDGSPHRSPGGDEVLSGADGSFALADVGAGPYVVHARRAGLAIGETTAVRGGAVDVRVVLGPEARLSGVVVSREGDPVADCVVWLAGADGAGRPVVPFRVREPSGAFTLEQVPPGRHELRITTHLGPGGMLLGSEIVEVAAGERRQGLRLVVGR
jgi:hypothetical protein